MNSSLLISTYNWPEALRLILETVRIQTVSPLEVVIADDGSGPETREVITEFRDILDIPIKHVWQEDRGFRASRIRNLAIKECEAEYIIQIDGDTLLHPRFIEDHHSLALDNHFISGSRVLVGESATHEAIKSGKFTFSPISRGIKNRLNALHFPELGSRYSVNGLPPEELIYKIRGCNMSFWKRDLLAINGYDENFEGWGREDSELVWRLLVKGCFLRQVKLAAIQYHLHHKPNSRNHFQENHLRLLEVMASATYYAENGIFKEEFDTIPSIVLPE
ncbi:glycosyltransferase family 2 protein [Leadbetterella byssophila]|uniref:Glycosyl transferase family 2 n=1 Tax=Leadbetterella byssophila (strain DSM 17132 / JCM 16389 / KACC 11308 / NBRC 106382 / 4M15) TaxID=649349 RepID=E4RYP8_LEAB4|nr:glycosyltransferase family 2 protein [Leadbetterella byssophila]ADQ16410.1 glycosyl transferase family 2 [Leadbetterella byssophila DSM 17132]